LQSLRWHHQLRYVCSHDELFIIQFCILKCKLQWVNENGSISWFIPISFNLKLRTKIRRNIYYQDSNLVYSWSNMQPAMRGSAKKVPPPVTESLSMATAQG
jgi:hypothetical protein